jgi:hypothetical protein
LSIGGTPREWNHNAKEHVYRGLARRHRKNERFVTVCFTANSICIPRDLRELAHGVSRRIKNRREDQ